MKIGILQLQQSSGGVDEHTIQLCTNWPQKADDIILFTNRDNESICLLSSSLKRLGVSTILLPGMFKKSNFFVSSLKRSLLLPLTIFNGCRFFFWLKNHNLDTLLIQSGSYPGSREGLSAIFGAKALGIRTVILVVHHGAVHNNILRLPFERFIDFLVQKCVSKIIAVSQATRQTLISNRGFDPSVKPIRVIHNGLNLYRPQNKSVSLNFYKQFGICETRLLFGIVGRVEQYKGHEDLLMAIAYLSKVQQQKIALLFIGSVKQAEKNRLLKIMDQLRIETQVIFTDRLNEPSQILIKQLDLLFMLTKDFEGFGLTVLEAMLNQVPVIATKVGALTEFAPDYAVTYVSPESPRQVRKAIESFLDSPDGFQKKLKLAEKKSLDYSAIVMAEEYHREVKIWY